MSIYLCNGDATMHLKSQDLPECRTKFGTQGACLILKRGIILCVFGLLFSLNSFSLAAETILTDPETGSQVILDIQAPKYIYHWTRIGTLAQIAKDKSFSDSWETLGNIKLVHGVQKSSIFIGNWPQFRDSPHGGLFTWTHPVLGMKGGPYENYGHVLIRIEVDVANVRAASLIRGTKIPLNSSDIKPVFNLPFNTSDIDLVFNGFEWILLNPKAIKTFTADIDILKPDLERELRLLQDPQHVYDRKDIHLMDFKDPINLESHLKHAEDTIKDLLNAPRNSIPFYFRRDSEGRPLGRSDISNEESNQIFINYLNNRHKAIARLKAVKNLKSALLEIEKRLSCNTACLDAELTYRLELYLLNHPEHSSLREVLVKYRGLRAPISPFITELDLERAKNVLRKNVFNPFESILEISLLFANSNKEAEWLMKYIDHSKLSENFKEAYNEGDFSKRAPKNAGYDVLKSSPQSAAMAKSCTSVFK